MKVSLCMVLMDSVKNLYHGLNSAASVASEIIIAAVKATELGALAQEFGIPVQILPSNGDFTKAVNCILEKATGDWILFLKPGEELVQEGSEPFNWLSQDESISGYFFRREVYLRENTVEERYPDIVFRLFKNRPEYRFHGVIYEQIVDVLAHEGKFGMAEKVFIRYEDESVVAENLSTIAGAMREHPADKYLHYHYGLELYRRKEYTQAIAIFIKVAAELGEDAIFLPLLVRYLLLCFYEQQQYANALGIIEQGLVIFPDFADLYYFQGLIHFEQQAYGRAYASFCKALALPCQPCNYIPIKGAQGFSAYYYVGLIAEAFCNYEEALRNYLLSLRDNSSFVTALEGITRILNPLEEADYAQAALEKVCEFNTSQAKLCIAELLLKQSAHRLAYGYLEGATQNIAETPDVALKKAICLIQQREYSQAIAKCDSIGPQHAEYQAAVFNKLFCYWLQGSQQEIGRWSEALALLELSEDFNNVVMLLKHNLGKRNFLKVSLQVEGKALLLDVLQRTFAMGEWERALTLLDGVKPETLDEMSLAIGQLCFTYGYPKVAEQYVNRHLDKNRQSHKAYFLLAQVKEQQGLYLEAHYCYRQAMGLDSKNPQYYKYLVRLYEKMRLDIISQATEKYPEILVLPTFLEEVSNEI